MTQRSTSETIRASGGCLCGAVRYRVRGPLRPVVNCHCTQCRRTSGHYVAATACRPKDLTLTASEELRWYRSSETARRGFCGRCGSNLFWEPADKERDEVMILAGTLDKPTGLETAAHIFTADAGDYYTLTDKLPKLPAGYRPGRFGF